LEHIIINADVLFLFMRASGETAEQMEASSNCWRQASNCWRHGSKKTSSSHH